MAAKYKSILRWKASSMLGIAYAFAPLGATTANALSSFIFDYPKWETYFSLVTYPTK